MFITKDKTVYNNFIPNGVDGWNVTGELENKIKNHYPWFEFVEGESGELLDISPTDPPEPPEPPTPGKSVWDELADAIREGVNTV